MFPDDGKTDVITCSMLTQDFLIFGTEVGRNVMCNIQPICLAIVIILQGGILQYFFIEDWQYVNEFRHVVGKHNHCYYCAHVHTTHTCMHAHKLLGLNYYFAGIRQLYPDSNGTHLVFVDDKSDSYLYNPVSL